jgi:hypothetical protein
VRQRKRLDSSSITSDVMASGEGGRGAWREARAEEVRKCINSAEEGRRRDVREGCRDGEGSRAAQR